MSKINFDRRKGMFSFRLFLLAFLLVSSISYAQTIYITPEEALKIIFSNSEKIDSEKKTLNPEQKQILQKLGCPTSKDTWTFFVAKTGTKIDGYAVIDNQIGKTEPITFLTALSPDGSVKAVEILVYRESHGSEVRHKAFLNQYNGKKANDPIRTGQDIKNVTGATLSSRALSVGVKRDVAIWKIFYGS